MTSSRRAFNFLAKVHTKMGDLRHAERLRAILGR